MMSVRPGIPNIVISGTQLWLRMETPPTYCSNLLFVEAAKQNDPGLKGRGWIILKQE